MSAFRGELQGTGALAIRLGTNQSGIYSFLTGWGCSIKVKGAVSPTDGKEIFQVYVGDGTNNNNANMILLATIRQTAKGFKVDMERENEMS